MTSHVKGPVVWVVDLGLAINCRTGPDSTAQRLRSSVRDPQRMMEGVGSQK